MKSLYAAACAAVLACACATVEKPPEVVVPVSSTAGLAAQAAIAEAAPAAPRLKRKVAVGRFTNATRYGRALLYDGESDPLAEQATDIMSNRLAETGAFIVIERNDIELLENEATLSGEAANLIGVDAILVGSVTEFGRKTEGKSGFLSSTKRQGAEATVEVRLIDAKTGIVFSTATGSGEAASEVGETLGFGTRAAFDATLTDKALSAAIADLMTDVLSEVTGRAWSTDILRADGNTVYLSGGTRQGLTRGDVLVVERQGEAIRSGQSGATIRLPGQEIARIELLSFFGEDELSEGAVAQVIEGAVPASTDGLIVREAGE